MRRRSILALLAWLCCCYAGGAPAPEGPDPELPKGVTQVALPEGSVTFVPVRNNDGWVVHVRAKGVTITAPRLFLRDKDKVIELAAEKEEKEGAIKITTPDGTSSYFGGGFTWGKGTFVVRPAREGGRDRIRAGDVVLTHPRLRVEVGDVDHLEIRSEAEKPK